MAKAKSPTLLPLAQLNMVSNVYGPAKEVQLFGEIAAGIPFVLSSKEQNKLALNQRNVYLKTGSSSALVLAHQDIDKDSTKVVFKKKTKIRLVTVELNLGVTVQFSAGHEKSLEVGANAGHVPAVDYRSDITQSVTERAGG